MKDMQTESTSLRIASILFDNTDTKVLIKGETVKNHLSYPSEMFISFSELNQLMNYLQKENPSVSVSELFIEESMGNDYTQTSLDGYLLENQLVDINLFCNAGSKKLIRA